MLDYAASHCSRCLLVSMWIGLGCSLRHFSANFLVLSLTLGVKLNSSGFLILIAFLDNQCLLHHIVQSVCFMKWWPIPSSLHWFNILSNRCRQYSLLSMLHDLLRYRHLKFLFIFLRRWRWRCHHTPLEDFPQI